MRFLKRTAALFAAITLASCFGDSTGPGALHQARFAIAPVFDARAIRLVNFDSVHVHLTRPADGSVALDTTIFFPANVDTMVLDLQVTITGSAEPFNLTLDLIDNATHSIVFHSGPTTVTATYSSNPVPATPPLVYVGVGSHAAGVRWVQSPASVYFQDTVTYIAEAFDSASGATIPNTPIDYSSSDTVKARPLANLPGKVVAGIQRGSATITASLLTNVPPVTKGLLVQPKPAAIAIQGGNNQTAPVGTAAPQQLVARVNAVDNLGVQGVVVTFAVTGGGGSLTKLVDTTDANGDAHTTWTLGGTLGNQSVSATVTGLAPSSVSFAATAIVGLPKKVAFIAGGQPTNTAAGSPITPAVKVAVQDTFGNTVTSSTANVTVALGANPGSSTLSGTLTVAAVAGVATFSNLSLNNPGTAYTLTATSGTLSGATSASFDIAGGIPVALAIVQQPTNTTGGSAIAPAITVEIRDALNNKVAGATNTVTVAIGANPASGTLGGTVSVAAVAGTATFSNLTIDNAGTGYTLVFASTGLTGATSASFDIAAGPATSLQFNVQPPSSAFFQAPFTTTVKALDAGGNLASSFTGNVTIGIGTNPATGTVFGTTTVAAVAGVATFTGINIDNIGAGYTLSATSGSLTAATSNAMAIVSTPGINAWINTAGGNWSVGSNWSKGLAPVASDTVAIAQSGTYTVNFDVSAGNTLLLGAPLGIQTFSQSLNTLTLGTNGVVRANGRYILSGGTINGGATLDVNGGFDWQGGTINNGNLIRVNSGGTLSISGAGGRTLDFSTIENNGTAIWSGTGAVSAGNGGTIRNGATGTFDYQGDAPFQFNFGTRPVFDNQGAFQRSTSANTVTWQAAVNNAGTFAVQSSTMSLAGGGTSSGTFTAGPGAEIDFSAQTQTMSGGSLVNGAGVVAINGGTVNTSGGWAVAGSTDVSAGALNYNGASGSVSALSLSGGTMGGSGVFQVTGSMVWSGGGLVGTGQTQVAGGVTITGAASKTIDTYTLVNQGTGGWVGTGTISGGNGGTLRNAVGATFTEASDATFLFGFGTRPVFDNLGTLTRSPSTGTVTWQAALNNSGTVNVQTGTMSLTGGGTSTGSFAVSAGAFLGFNGQTHTISGGVSGAGEVVSTAGTATFSGAYNVTGATRITGGTLNFNTASGSTRVLQLISGTNGGTGVIQTTDTLDWQGGTMIGTGTSRSLPSSALLMTGTATRTLDTRVVENQGPGTWTGTGAISGGNGGVLRNAVGAGFALQGDASFNFTFGTRPVFNNLGTFARATSAGTATWQAAVDNDGTFSIQTGTMALGGGGTSNGNFDAQTGATLQFSGGTHTLGSTSHIQGPGSIEFTGSTTNLNGVLTVTGTTRVTGGTANFNTGPSTDTTAALVISGGTQGGTGTLVATGATTWSGGGMAGSGITRAAGPLTISGAGALNFDTHTLEVAGAGTYTTTGGINGGNSSVIRVVAGGSLDLQSNGTLGFGFGTRPTLDNQGTLNRTTSAGTISLQFALTSSGAMNVNTGLMDLTAGGTLGGTPVIAAVLQNSGGTLNLGNGVSATGAGELRLTGGTLGLAGATASLAKLKMNGGTLSHTGLLTINTFTWSAGTINGAGTTRVPTGAGNALVIDSTVVKTLDTHILELGAANGTYTTTGNISAGNGGTIRVLSTGTLQLQSNATFAFGFGITRPVLDNLGIVTRNTSGGTLQLQASLTNNAGATLNLTTGTLDLNGGSSLSGTVNVTTGAMLWSGATQVLQAGLSNTGAGTITMTGGSLNLNTATATLQRLKMNGGTIGHAQSLNIGTFTWSAGTINGAGTTTATTSLVIDSTTVKTLDTHTLTLATGATGTWTTTGNVSAGNGAILRVASGATYDLQSNGAYLFGFGVARPVLDNLGTLNRSLGAAIQVQAALTNTGALNVTSGTLNLDGGGTLGGTLNIGTLLTITTQTANVAPGVSQVGAGTITLIGGGLGLSGATATLNRLKINGGTLSHTGTLTVNNLTWSGGNITGAGTTTIPAGANTLLIDSVASKTFDSHLLQVAAPGLLTSAGNISGQNGATLRVLATGSLDIQSNATFAFSAGVVRPVLDNQGTLTRSTAGTYVLQAQLKSSNVLNLTAGTLQLAGGTDSITGATLSTGTVLDVAGAVLDLRSGSSVTGAGILRSSTGGTVTVDSGLTASVANLDINGGLVDHKSTLNVTGALTWQSGQLSSNPAGGGAGITRIAAAGTLNINGAGSKTFTGPHTLDLLSGAGSAVYSGAGNVSTGSGSILQNARIFDWQSAGSWLYNLGGAQSIIRNLASGTLLHSVTGVHFFQSLIDNQGLINITQGTFTIGNGATGNFTGTATVSAGALLTLGPGTYSQTGNFAVTGDILIGNAAANLTLNGRTFTVSGNLSTGGTGVITMTNNADSLDIGGNATFGGGLGTMNAGVIRLAGNFSQTGAGNFKGLAQSAAVAHRVRLVGGNTTINFADPTNSFFRRLLVASNAGTSRTMTSDVRTTFFSLGGGTYSFKGSAGPPMTQLIADTIAGASSGSVSMASPMVLVANAGNIVDSNVINVDTVVFAGSNQAITTNTAGFGSYTYHSIRVSQSTGTATFAQATNLTNDLNVTAGALSLNSFHVGVSGNFGTSAAGSLFMGNANDSLGVAGNVSFAGSSSASMTAGIIEVKGNFSQSGALNSFAPSVAHKTRFNLAGSAVVQTIQFANPTTSFFDSLDLNRGPGTRGTVNFLTDARINRGLSIQNSTDVTGPTARITVAGGSLTASQSTTSPTMLTTRAFELAVTPPQLANMVGAVNISPDTFVINAGIATLPVASGIHYKSIRVNTGANLTMAAATIANDLHVATGTALFNSAINFTIGGKLRTTGTGAFSMTTGGIRVVVTDSAVFGGSTTTGLLTNGTLVLLGHFRQTGTSTFQASGFHATRFEGTGLQTISFASPGTGAAQSRFHQVILGHPVAGASAPSGIALLSDMSLSNSIADTATNGVIDSIVGNGFTVTAVDLATADTNLVFNNAQLVLNAPTNVNFQGVRMRNMNPASTYFTINMAPGTAISVTRVNFLPAPTTGKYLAWTLTSAGSRTVTVSNSNLLSSAFTTGNETRTNVNGSVTINWPGGALP